MKLKVQKENKSNWIYSKEAIDRKADDVFSRLVKDNFDLYWTDRFPTKIKPTLNIKKENMDNIFEVEKSSIQDEKDIKDINKFLKEMIEKTMEEGNIILQEIKKSVMGLT